MKILMKYFLSLLLTASILTPFAAKADIAPDVGFHRVTQCAFIDNLADYPDYDVYATHNWRFGPSLILSQNLQTLSDGCEDSGTPFFAVKKSDQAKIQHQNDPGQERGDIWNELAINKPYLLEATTTGARTDISKETVNGDLPDTNPAVWFVAVYHIDTLTDANFNVRLVRETRYDADGQLVSSTTVSGDDDVNEKTAASWFEDERLPWIVLIGVGIILLAVAVRSKKK